MKSVLEIYNAAIKRLYEKENVGEIWEKLLCPLRVIKAYELKHKVEFYYELKNELMHETKNNKEMINAYKISCENYKYFEANIVITTLIATIFAIGVNMIFPGGGQLDEIQKVLSCMESEVANTVVMNELIEKLAELVNEIGQTVWGGTVLIVGALVIGFCAIILHSREMKYKRVLSVLNTMSDK